MCLQPEDCIAICDRHAEKSGKRLGLVLFGLIVCVYSGGNKIFFFFGILLRKHTKPGCVEGARDICFRILLILVSWNFEWDQVDLTFVLWLLAVQPSSVTR
jgi:hypothetical protein